MLSIFLCACLPSMCLLWGNVYFDLQFLNELFQTHSILNELYQTHSILNELYKHICLHIFEINLLSVVSLANIFSHSEGCLFVLLLISFAVQKFVSLIRYHLFIFAFITLKGGSKNLAAIYVKECSVYIFL